MEFQEENQLKGSFKKKPNLNGVSRKRGEQERKRKLRCGSLWLLKSHENKKSNEDNIGKTTLATLARCAWEEIAVKRCL